jgi:predicted exporter
VLLILVAFRALRPLWLSILVIAVGVLCALSASLWLFGELHVAALLFGVSLIGISVDYSLIFCAQRFSADELAARERLRRVMAGLVLGLATTLIGYVTLLLAPFPGLHQLAAFSGIGVTASFITVVAWLPNWIGMTLFVGRKGCCGRSGISSRSGRCPGTGRNAWRSSFCVSASA